MAEKTYHKYNFVRTGLVRCGIAGLCAILLTACSGYDVEFNSPLLNTMGIDLNSKKTSDVKLKDRPTLVVPPSPKLPEPGKVATAPENVDWPDDPDVRAKKLAELKRQQEIAEGKSQSPVSEALQTAVDAMREEDDIIDDKKQTAEGNEQQGGILDSSGDSGGSSNNIDMEQRTQDMIR